MATTIEQVIIGKMSLPAANGQIAPFDPPQSFTWLKYFSAEEIADFLGELLDALHMSQQNGDWSGVAEVIEDWRETASIKADETTSGAIAQGLSELREGKGTSWTELQQEMRL